MALVRASAPFATNINGWQQVVQPTDIYDDTDPLVRAHPDCFEQVRATAGVAEQATAAPGERRDVRRPR